MRTTDMLRTLVTRFRYISLRAVFNTVYPAFFPSLSLFFFCLALNNGDSSSHSSLLNRFREQFNPPSNRIFVVEKFETISVIFFCIDLRFNPPCSKVDIRRGRNGRNNGERSNAVIRRIENRWNGFGSGEYTFRSSIPRDLSAWIEWDGRRRIGDREKGVRRPLVERK